MTSSWTSWRSGEQGDGFDLLSGGLNTDLNAAGQGIFRILQDQLSLAAAEHLLKDLTKILVDLVKFRDEDGGHFLGDLPDDAFQLPLGGEHIVPLGSKIGVSLVNAGIFLNGTQVWRSQRTNFPLELRNPNHAAENPGCSRLASVCSA